MYIFLYNNMQDRVDFKMYTYSFKKNYNNNLG